MDTILNIKFTWGNFLTVGLSLVALYFVLQFAESILKRAYFLGRFQKAIKDLVHYILLIYEPLVIFVLSSAFVLLNPAFHGLIAGIVIIGGFNHLRNYLNGRIIQFDNAVALGNRLRTGSLQGIISQTGRLGLKLRTNKGLHFISYSQLLANGFLILAGDEIGGFYQLKVTPKELVEKRNNLLHLSDLLTTTPYLDWNHKPELSPSSSKPNQINVRISVIEESHLKDLVTLFNEWGYSCEISEK